jgi:hypothetical protein
MMKSGQETAARQFQKSRAMKRHLNPIEQKQSVEERTKQRKERKAD